MATKRASQLVPRPIPKGQIQLANTSRTNLPNDNNLCINQSKPSDGSRRKMRAACWQRDMPAYGGHVAVMEPGTILEDARQCPAGHECAG